MAQLLKTTPYMRGKAKGHTHMVYIGRDGGVSSMYKDHTHGVRILMDPATGTLQGIVIEESDGHSHELAQLELVEKKDNKTDDELHSETISLWEFAKKYEEDSRKKGEDSEKFYDGTGQWDYKVKQELESKQRACLTINEIQPKADLLSGYQRQNRSDIHYYPTEGGDGKVAEILNIVVKNILDQNDYEYEETSVFEDMLITGRGLIHVYADYDDNLVGDIKIEHMPWRYGYFGPHEKLDAADCEYICKSKWYSKAKIEQMWPEKVEEFASEVDLAFPKEQISEDGYDKETTAGTIIGPDYVNVAKKEFRVITCERKEFESVPVLVNAADDFYFNARNLKTADLSAAKTLPGMTEVKKKVHRIRITTITKGTLLDDKYEEHLNDFHLIPAYAKKRGANWWGKVEGSKDPQRELNKRHSQTVDILNKTGAHGYFYDNDTFGGDQKALSDWKKNHTSPGFNQKIADVSRPPLPAEPVQFPSELLSFAQVESFKIKEIWNVNQEMLGLEGNAKSGLAMQEQKRQGLIGNEFLFDNLNRAKKKLGRTIVRYIQKLYTPERILRVIQDRNTQKPVEIGGKPMADIPQEDILALLKTADLTKFDVAVSQSSHNPTMRAANFAVWAGIADKRPDVPLPFLIELSDVPDKDKFLEMYGGMMKQKQEQEQAKNQTEITKTLIAKGAVPGPQGPIQ